MRRLDDLPVLAYDRRGYHRSRDLPVATTVAQHAEDLLALIDGRRSVVVGHSFGGVVALAAVAQGGKSSGIEAVAAYEAPLLWLDWDPTRASTDLLRDVDPADYAEAFFKRVVGSDAWERLPERIRIDRLADGPALVAELAAIRTTIAPFDFAALSVPVLAGRGERSLPHQRRGAELLVERVAHAELFEIPGAGHGAHLTHPDGFASFVRRAVALARHEPPPG
jgi:pimeloyl-ACP methyl ester carboxylesterase